MITLAQDSGLGVYVVVAELVQMGQPLQVDKDGAWTWPPTQQTVASCPVPDTVLTTKAEELISSGYVKNLEEYSEPLSVASHLPLIAPGHLLMYSSAFGPVSRLVLVWVELRLTEALAIMAIGIANRLAILKQRSKTIFKSSVYSC